MKIENIKTRSYFILSNIIRWGLIASVVAVLVGIATAVFVKSLEWVTQFRESHVLIIALLPISGFLVGLIYHKLGKEVEAGSNLIIDEIHSPKKILPFRMFIFILGGTILTHLFGGSAGREGTAVQMGGSLADQLTSIFRLKDYERKILLMVGISAGFSSVFGTPLAGAIFALEVLSIGEMNYDAIFPCFIAAIVADQVTSHFVVHPSIFQVSFFPPLTFYILISIVIAGAFFGVIGTLFAKLTHGISHLFKKQISYPPFRPLIGGFLVALLVWAFHTTRFIGLGIPTMDAAFVTKLPPWYFAAKLGFTSLTLGSGFVGGEVTPLFFIGSTLGNALSHILPLPMDLLASIGFVAVFAGAANTPLTCTILAMEIFGSQIGVFAGLACVISYVVSSHRGIFHAQLVRKYKNGNIEIKMVKNDEEKENKS